MNNSSDNWFIYPITVHPHHTDYGGIAWHGSYIAWMEEARVECLRAVGMDYAELVAAGCELPVVELNVRYHHSLKMGMTAIIKTKMIEAIKPRISWKYQIQSPDERQTYVTATVTLVPVDREKGKIMRQLPETVSDVFVKMSNFGKL
jgi:acyl-CoA thioester hydrolase